MPLLLAVVILALAALIGERALALAVLTVIVVSPFAFRRGIRNVARKSPLLKHQTSLEADDEGLTQTGPAASSRIAWSHFGGCGRAPAGEGGATVRCHIGSEIAIPDPIWDLSASTAVRPTADRP